MGKRGPRPLITSERTAGRRHPKDGPLPADVEIPIDVGANRRAPKIPLYLKPAAAKEWRRVVPLLSKDGSIRSTDLAVLAAYCSQYAEWLEYDLLVIEHGAVFVGLNKEGQPYSMESPYVRLRNRALATMLITAKLLQMAPGARPALVAEAQKQAGAREPVRTPSVPSPAAADDPRNMFRLLS